MADITNPKVNTFLGLNNTLDPCSAEYREGMAYCSDNMRIDESGLWTSQPATESASSAPTTLSLATVTGAVSGEHFKPIVLAGTQYIGTGLAGNSVVDAGPNGYGYALNSGTVKWFSSASSGTAGLSVPVYNTDFYAPTTANTTGTRALNGDYYYMCTFYDSARQIESLPGTVYKVTIDSTSTTKLAQLQAKGSTVGSTVKVRWYRTLRSSASDGVYNPVNIFYFVAEVTNTTAIYDYCHDNEILSYEYEGRGSAPPSSVNYLASYNNRMLYFKGNTVYWSSNGRPEEVAQEYTLTYDGASTLKMKPKLSIGTYGEAKYDIAELAGQTVKAAMLKDGRLWIWTEGMVGYLEQTNRLEGYRFRVHMKGIGAVNDKVLAYTHYGIFGADRQGIWLLTNGGTVKRLSEGVVDMHTSGKSTYIAQSSFAELFGVWVPRLNEYWLGYNGTIIPFQATRGVFVGPYTISGIKGGCTFVSTGGAQVYLTGGVTAKPATSTSSNQHLQFWMGQSALYGVKDNVKIELVFSANPGCTIVVYQNNIASTTGASSITVNSASGTLVQTITPHASGRMFMVDIAASSTFIKLAAVNYKVNIIPWDEKAGR